MNVLDLEGVAVHLYHLSDLELLQRHAVLFAEEPVGQLVTGQAAAQLLLS
ncbi:MAG TPA: hypothetical protein P5148_14995 [Anaerolineae bacterium]|nr:hypothetical protein [Anaerolineae bacterium]HRX04452.1 hypothetical protein [Anaerolineae bacterium]